MRPVRFPCYPCLDPPARIIRMSTDPKAISVASDHWRKCSSCKKLIAYSKDYWVCNVSTCNRKRTGLIFCGVSCWDAHLPLMNHRESWAEERRAPTHDDWERALRGDDETPRTRKTKATSHDLGPSQSAAPAKIILRRPSS